MDAGGRFKQNGNRTSLLTDLPQKRMVDAVRLWTIPSLDLNSDVLTAPSKPFVPQRCTTSSQSSTSDTTRQASRKSSRRDEHRTRKQSRSEEVGWIVLGGAQDRTQAWAAEEEMNVHNLWCIWEVYKNGVVRYYAAWVLGIPRWFGSILYRWNGYGFIIIRCSCAVPFSCFTVCTTVLLVVWLRMMVDHITQGLKGGIRASLLLIGYRLGCFQYATRTSTLIPSEERSLSDRNHEFIRDLGLR